MRALVPIALLALFFGAGAQAANIAPQATVTASAEYLSDPGNFLAVNAVDGVVAGYPCCPQNEWAIDASEPDKWIQLDWSELHSIDSITLHDRPNGWDNHDNDRVLSGTLTFSDSSSIAVGALPPDGTGLVIPFDRKIITWVRFTIDTWGPLGHPGLAEIVVEGLAVPPQGVPFGITDLEIEIVN